MLVEYEVGKGVVEMKGFAEYGRGLVGFWWKLGTGAGRGLVGVVVKVVLGGGWEPTTESGDCGG